jgi:putative transposase
MKKNIAYKMRIYPNRIQRELISKTFGCVRFVYNKMLEDRTDYYNKTGLKSNDNNYNVIVGISSNYNSAYADIGRCDDTIGGAGTEPIKNWKLGDSDWDGDLDDSFSAMKYYSANKKCPQVAYIHYYPVEHNLYLINREQITSLLDTFSYKAAQDNEQKY